MRGFLERLLKREKTPKVPPGKRLVSSLLDAMQDGREYQSLVDCVPHEMNVRDELRRGVAEVEAVRERPLLLYAGNVITTTHHPYIGMNQADELPFAEMVDAVPADTDSIDVMVITPGGSAQTASYFVDALRSRFAHVSFLIPYSCMSAGTILILSGDEIWMDKRAYIGPIDPQVLNRDGNRLVPLLSIWVLLNKIQKEGEKALSSGGQPDWTHLQLLRNLDHKDLGDSLSASDYATKQAAEYLENYKFRGWTTRETSGTEVTTEYRSKRATAIARQLCDHELWKMHSHRIPRDSVESDLRLKIERMESDPSLERAIHRLWTLLYYLFENTIMVKILLSSDYALFRNRVGAPTP